MQTVMEAEAPAVKVDADSHENKKLRPNEIALIEYAFFSLCEEVDIFYCQHKEEEVAFETEFDEATMRDSMMSILEGLESYPCETEQWHSYLMRLYLLSMGLFRGEGDKPARAAEAS